MTEVVFLNLTSFPLFNGMVRRPRLNMKLDLQSFFGLHVQLFSLAEAPQPPPPPAHLGSYTKALLVSQDRRHLFVTY